METFYMIKFHEYLYLTLHPVHKRAYDNTGDCKVSGCPAHLTRSWEPMSSEKSYYTLSELSRDTYGKSSI
jgi:hypothetical protein